MTFVFLIEVNMQKLSKKSRSDHPS